jgi:hypothetical protein
MRVKEFDNTLGFGLFWAVIHFVLGLLMQSITLLSNVPAPVATNRMRSSRSSPAWRISGMVSEG